MKKKKTVKIYELDSLLAKLRWVGVPTVKEENEYLNKAFFVRSKDFGFSGDITRKKNGEPDMRYKVNKYLFLGVKNEN